MKKLALYLLLLTSFLFVTNKASASVIMQINAGGGSQGTYVADQNYTGGQAYFSSTNVDTTGVVNPAPEAVYQSVRYGNVTYSLPNLTPNTPYTLRFHFNELYWGTSLSGNSGGIGSRVFNVTVNGNQVLTNFDIFASAGGANKAIVREFPVTADTNGIINIQFTTVTDNAMINGIELLSGDSLTPTPTPTPTPILINTANIVDGAVTTPKLANGAVDGLKMLDNIISTAKLIDGAVTTPKIADGAITLGKISNDASETNRVQTWVDDTGNVYDIGALGSSNVTMLNTGIVVTIPAGKAYYYTVNYDGQFFYYFSERANSSSGLNASWAVDLYADTTEIGIPIYVVQTGYRLDWNAVGANNYWIVPYHASWVVRLGEGTHNLKVQFAGNSDNTMNTGHIRFERMQVLRNL